MSRGSCSFGSPRCEAIGEIRVRIPAGDTAWEAWYCREHATHMVHMHGGQAVGKR